MLAAVIGIIYGLSTLGSIELKILHERQPLFVMQSDGSVQNKYELKILNKLDHDIKVRVAVTGHSNLRVVGGDELIAVSQGRVAAYTVFIRIPGDELHDERLPIDVRVEDTDQPEHFAVYQSMFFGPKR